MGAIFLTKIFFVSQEPIFPVENEKVADVINASTGATAENLAPAEIAHVKRPESLRAIYMTSWVAGTPSLRDDLLKLVKETEINALVVDIKDATGRIAYAPLDQKLVEIGAKEERIKNLPEFLAELHRAGIYVIGRVAVFQDPYFVSRFPSEAVKVADGSKVWADHKGLSWIDPNSHLMWEYAAAIGLDAYAQGFDEINFDYIRFPSDGNMKDISFPMSGVGEKPLVLKSFFAYLKEIFEKENIPISADIFGMVTTNTDDLNIGQVFENTLPYFDYVYPMVYPSHFPAGWAGFKNPAASPGEVITKSMGSAVARLKVASSTKAELAPWLQDFDLGADYDAKMVRAQIEATYALGLDSWLIWNASNRYTKDAFLLEVEAVTKNER